MTSETTPTEHRSHKPVLMILSCCVILLFGVCGFLVFRNHQLTAKQQTTAVAQTQKLITKLSTLIALPAGQPSVVTVLDRLKLGDARLVDEAQNGDQLVIYASAKRVILYRPTSSKVIDMFHVDDKATAASTATKPTP